MATVDPGTMLRIVENASVVKVPSASDRVYKDECMFSFAGPESEGGIFLNMSTLQGFGKKFVSLDYERTGNVLYYNEVHRRVPLGEEELAAQASVPETMAIGTETGFNAKRTHNIEKESFIFVLPEEAVISLPNDQLPERVLAAVAAIQVRRKSVPLA